jgi:ABC-type branched-subunit amino acid transport system substrate-binding protein
MVNRRSVLLGVGASVVAHSLTYPSPAVASVAVPIRVGVLWELNGRTSHEEQMRLGLELALGDLDPSRGILGKAATLTFRRVEAGSQNAGRAVQDLVRRDGVDALVTDVGVDMQRRVDAELERAGRAVPVIHTAQTANGESGPFVHIGSTTVQAVKALRGHLGNRGERMFQVLDWDTSRRALSRQLREIIGEGAAGLSLIDSNASTEPGQYRGLVRYAHGLGARNFWISLRRPDAIEIVAEAHHAGIGGVFNYHYLNFSEWHARQLPLGAEVWTALPFVASAPDAAVQDFVAKVRRTSAAEFVSHVAYSHYCAILALRSAMERVDATSGRAVSDSLNGLAVETPTGRLVLSAGRAPMMPMYVVKATHRGLEVVQKITS